MDNRHPVSFFLHYLPSFLRDGWKKKKNETCWWRWLVLSLESSLFCGRCGIYLQCQFWAVFQSYYTDFIIPGLITALGKSYIYMWLVSIKASPLPCTCQSTLESTKKWSPCSNVRGRKYEEWTKPTCIRCCVVSNRILYHYSTPVSLNVRAACHFSNISIKTHIFI